MEQKQVLELIIKKVDSNKYGEAIEYMQNFYSHLPTGRFLFGENYINFMATKWRDTYRAVENKYIKGVN
jgi:hypothetical protein